MKYTKDHEWFKIEGNNATMGITQYAADALGELVYVELPKKDTNYEKGDSFAVVESSKSASDVYIPISGKVTEVNKKLEETPELINNSPINEGWIAKIEISSMDEIEGFMSEEEYKKFLTEN